MDAIGHFPITNIQLAYIIFLNLITGIVVIANAGEAPIMSLYKIHSHGWHRVTDKSKTLKFADLQHYVVSDGRVLMKKVVSCSCGCCLPLVCNKVVAK